MTNDERAARAHEVLEFYSSRPGADSLEDAGIETTLHDLLADIMHLAKNEGVDWEGVSTMAEIHFNSEVDEEEAEEEEEEEEKPQSRKDWDPRISGAQLGAATVPAEVREVVEHIASAAPKSYKGAVAREYAMALLQDPRATESAEALRVQLVYLRGNLGWWKGPEAKLGKQILDRAIKDLR